METRQSDPDSVGYMLEHPDKTKANFLGFLALAKLAGHELNPQEMIKNQVNKIEKDTGQRIVPLSILYAQEALADIAEHQLEQERKISRTDHLTGLGNRLAMEEYWRCLGTHHEPDPDNSNTKRAIEGSTHSMVTMLDLSMFKTVNDALGHHIGDKLLSEIANGFRETFRRKSDRAFRVGGDEFVIILDCGDGSEEKSSKVKNWLTEQLSPDGPMLTNAKQNILDGYSDDDEIILIRQELKEMSKSLSARYGRRFNRRKFKRIMKSRNAKDIAEYIFNNVVLVFGDEPVSGNPWEDSLKDLIEVADRRSRAAKS